MWEIAKNVANIPFNYKRISDDDAKKIVFPLIAQKIIDIYLYNKKDKSRITYIDDRIRNANEKRAKEGDEITISFIPKSINNIIVDLVMKGIYRYTGSLSSVGKYYNEKAKKYSIENVKISITTGGETPGFKPMTKYCVSLPWTDLIFVEANVVYLKARYI